MSANLRELFAGLVADWKRPRIRRCPCGDWIRLRANPKTFPGARCDHCDFGSNTGIRYWSDTDLQTAFNEFHEHPDYPDHPYAIAKRRAAS